MTSIGKKHKNYEILNLIGYGLAKFNDDFIREFGFQTKQSFYDYFVKLGIAETVGTVKNRMDLFDHFFPKNGRKGWWQKGDAYIQRKLFIDSLFGNEDVIGFSKIVKMYLIEYFHIEDIVINVNPILKSKFKELQKTGLEAELFFIYNYSQINLFENGKIEDARLFGDGYDFEVTTPRKTYITEIKGIREKKGKIRLTQNEYNKAREYKDDYILTIVVNLNELPYFKIIENPIHNLSFQKKIIPTKRQIEYHLVDSIC